MIDEIVNDSLMCIVDEILVKLQNAKVWKQTSVQPGERMKQLIVFMFIDLCAMKELWQLMRLILNLENSLKVTAKKYNIDFVF